MIRLLFLSAIVLAGLFGADSAHAQALSLDLGEEGTLTGRVVQLVLLLTVLSLAPSILITVTSFTRMVVVLSLLRSAMGTQQAPPNIVMISLALFMTGFVMAPVFEEAYDAGLQPLLEEQIEPGEAFELMSQPFKTFMLKHVREDDLELFVNLSADPTPQTRQDIGLQVLIPSFMISELRRAFEIGFLLFIPFIVIDLVVSSVLMSMGMMMLPPIMIALPFKLIFFVLVDGWSLVAGSLVKSFIG
ncbi:MAG: flagellar type III secretion system pore protein FliP [Pseudomonadota bacterium]